MKTIAQGTRDVVVTEAGVGGKTTWAFASAIEAQKQRTEFNADLSPAERTALDAAVTAARPPTK